MSDDFNNNLNTEPVTPPVPETENAQPAFDYQPPQVDVPQTPAFESTPVQTDFSSAPAAEIPTVQNDVPPAYTFGQQPPVQGYQPQPNSYQQPPVQGYQPQPNPYQQPTAQGYQPQPNSYQQPPVQGYQPQPNSYQQPPVQGYQPQQDHTYSTGSYQYTPVNPAMVNAQNQTDGFAIASLILGITGICTCCTFIPGILGLIFGIVSKSSNDGTRPTGVSTAGIITSVVGLILNLLFILLMMVE